MCISECCAQLGCFYLFVYKQKTAYEVRISDWSSDVCSSDLVIGIHRHFLAQRVDHRTYVWKVVVERRRRQASVVRDRNRSQPDRRFPLENFARGGKQPPPRSLALTPKMGLGPPGSLGTSPNSSLTMGHARSDRKSTRL